MAVGPTKRQRPFRRTFLREWRTFRHLTQEQAADRMGIDFSTLSRIERGLVPYSQGVLEAAASAYNCAPEDLLAIDPFKEGLVIDFIQIMKEATDPVAVAEVVGYARGKLGKPN
jgi:transcriptional regulator with XRE-family HTH domain